MNTTEVLRLRERVKLGDLWFQEKCGTAELIERIDLQWVDEGGGSIIT